MNGNSYWMDTIEKDWDKGTISSPDEEKSFIRKAFHSNLPKRARAGCFNARRKLESLWNDGTLSATDEEKLSIRTDSNAAMQQEFEKSLKVEAMGGKWLSMNLINNYRKEGFISSTDDEIAAITNAYELAKAKK